MSDAVRKRLESLTNSNDTLNDVILRLLQERSGNDCNEHSAEISRHFNRSILPEKRAADTKELADRRAYLDYLSRNGIPLRHEERKIFIGPTGKRAAIATATERRPNHWFLGIGDYAFQENGTILILLCREGSELLDFVLPEALVSRIMPSMTKRNGEYKLNIIRESKGHYDLKIPHSTALNIASYLGAHNSIAGRQ